MGIQLGNRAHAMSVILDCPVKKHHIIYWYMTGGKIKSV